jgi:competence protein ComEC
MVRRFILFLLLFVLIVTIAFLVYQFYFQPDKSEVSKPIADTTGIPEFYLEDQKDTIAAVDAYHNSWRIHFFDVGQGDAILLQGKGKNILIDGGDRGTSVINHLTKLAIDTLHWVVATHPHADHIGGLLPVFRKFPVVNVLDPGVSHASSLYKSYRALVDSAASSYTRGFAGWSYNFTEDFAMQVIHPDTLASYDLNNSSLVVRVKMGDTYALFTGDMEKKAERAVLQRGDSIKSQLLKVAHHGSKTSSSVEFLAQVQAEVGILLLGHGNKYGFPHAETMFGLQNQNTTLYQSSLHGSVLALVNQQGYTIFTERDTTVEPVESNHATVAFVDVNSADLQTLTLIRHIGEATALGIIENRPFVSLDDLQRVRGLGPARIADIKAQGLAVIGE